MAQVSSITKVNPQKENEVYEKGEMGVMGVEGSS